MTFAQESKDRTLAAQKSVWRTGTLTGIWLLVIMLGALVLANRFPSLERFALGRNLICGGLFALAMAIPLGRFGRSASCAFASGLLAWAIFSAGYWAAGMFFGNLFAHLGKTPFQMFTIGAIVYGIAAVAFGTARTLHLTWPREASRERNDAGGP